MNRIKSFVLGLAFLASLSLHASLPVDNNWQGLGMVYANVPGSSTIGNTPNRFLVVNSWNTAQTPTATTRTYLNGSKVAISPLGMQAPISGVQAGTVITWQFDMTKTAAGSASSTIDIAFGTTGTVSDTAQVSFTKPAGVANADYGIVVVQMVVQSVNTSTGAVTGNILVFDNQTGAGGHLASGKYIYAQQVTSGSFNTTFAGAAYVGLCITTGASDSITINQVVATATAL